jgi:hypothetical protein
MHEPKRKRCVCPWHERNVFMTFERSVGAMRINGD